MKYRIADQNELKPSGLHWIDYLPKDWEKASLKYILNYVIGSTPSTSKDKYFFGDNIWVSISDIKDKYISDAKQRLSDDAIIDCNIKVVPKSSLLYSFKLSVGQMSFNTVDLYTNEAIASFLNNKNVNLDFWYYALGEYLIEYANKNIYGAKLLNQDLIKNARLLVPSKIEQQKIANFLDEKSKIFDNAILKKEQLISKLDFAKQSLISEVVTGKLRVVEQNSKLQTIKREKDELKPSCVEWLGDIPKEWEVKKLKYFTPKITSGSTPLGGSETYLDEGIPLLRSQNIHFKGLSLDNVAYISNEVHNQMKRSQLQEKDILINITGASIGRVAYIPIGFENGNVNQHVCIIRINHKVAYYKYISLFLSINYGQDQVFINQVGTSREGLSFEDLNNFNIVFPSLEEQKQISKYLDEKLIHFDNTIEKTKQSIKKLKLAKEALISQAVTGKIEIL